MNIGRPSDITGKREELCLNRITTSIIAKSHGTESNHTKKKHG